MEWRERHEKSAELANRLNEGKFFPEVNKGEVELRKWTDDDYEEDRAATQEELAELGVTRSYVDAHPEGSDRGGYVPYVECGPLKAFHYEGDNNWQAG